MSTVTSGKLVDSAITSGAGQGDMSGTVTSKTLALAGSATVGLHFVSAAAGTRAGTWVIQGSVDNTNWVTLSFTNSSGALVSSLTVTASTLHNDLVELADVGFPFLRCVFTNSTGTGTGNVTAAVKRQSRS